MSEYINNSQKRVDALYQITEDLCLGKSVRSLLDPYRDAIDHLTAHDILLVVHRLVEQDLPIEAMKTGINKALNIFYKSILSCGKVEVPKNHFLGILMTENRELEMRLNAIKPIAKAINKSENVQEQRKNLEQLRVAIMDLQEFDFHYSRKENILFPYFEKQFPEYKCLSIMWSIHDDIKAFQKKILEELKVYSSDVSNLNMLLGDLFFAMYAIIFREEYLLFPVALHAVPQQVWQEMNQHSNEIGYSYINAPQYAVVSSVEAEKESLLNNGMVDLGTGKMKVEQLITLLNHLPVDITMVDQNDRVLFFSNPKERFFTRSKAIIGRTVQNCHPPESVHMVNDLLKAFKNGQKEKEDFWIQMKGRFVLIQYFALRDETGNYTGCIEVSQDITEIKKLEGEKRLMDS